VTLAELDAVTLDANGTLVALADPVPALRRLLAKHGIERPAEVVERAVEAEFVYYRAHMSAGRDAPSLARLYRDCTAVFLDAAGAPLDAGALAAGYVSALRFELLPGVREALVRLRAHGLALAVVSNWDCRLPEHLARLGVSQQLAVIVTSAETGAAKPDPAIFAHAIERLGVAAERTLHVGDTADDRLGAAAAGLHFAPAPLPAVVDALA
jgi:putative hydrolase of the HAD superfamily